MPEQQRVDFQCDVLEQSHDLPVLVDFWAEWCAPCRMLAPVLEHLAEKHAGRWKLVKINTEEHPEAAARFNVRSIPSVKLFIKGEVRDEFTGALPEQQIEEWLQRALPSPWQKELDMAEGFAAEGKRSMALSLVEGVVRKEPDNHQAIALLVRLKLFRQPAEALQHSEALEADADYAELAETARTLAPLVSLDPAALPDDEVKADYLAAVAAMKEEQFDAALSGFIDVLRRNRLYHDDGSRKACIALFRYLGEGHETTLRHRRAFDRAF